MYLITPVASPKSLAIYGLLPINLLACYSCKVCWVYRGSYHFEIKDTSVSSLLHQWKYFQHYTLVVLCEESA